MSGVLLRIAPWLALAVALIGGGWWGRGVLAGRATLAAQVEGLSASVEAWSAAYAEQEADRVAVVEALTRAHDQIATVTATRAATLEAIKHAPDLDDPLPDAGADILRGLYANPDGAD